MNLLYLAHRIPYPPNKGDKIRSFNEIKHLSRRHRIDLACLADDPADLKHVEKLRLHCRRIAVEPLKKSLALVFGALALIRGSALSVGYFYNRRLQRTIDCWLNETAYDAIICFSSPMAEYVFKSKKLPRRHKDTGWEAMRLNSEKAPPLTIHDSRFHDFTTSRLIMDFCDVDSDKWRQYAAQASFPKNLIFGLEFRRLLAYEKRINRCFARSVFVSKHEAELFRRLCPAARSLTVIPNGVDHDYFSPAEAKPSSFPASQLPSRPAASLSRRPASRLLFAGAMDYQANVDGVKWFCDQVWPKVREIASNVEFMIVGSNPTLEVKSLEGYTGVTVTGFVEDIRPWYQSADICVIPLRVARGVQNKVLEAMAMGKAVVTTSAANQGIGATHDAHLMICDSPQALAETVCSLLIDPEKRNSLGQNARNFVLDRFNWETSMNRLDSLIGQDVSFYAGNRKSGSRKWLKAGKRGGQEAIKPKAQSF